MEFAVGLPVRIAENEISGRIPAQFMEKSVLFIDRDEYLYREQRLMTDYIKMGNPSLADVLKIKDLSAELRNSIELIFLEAIEPFPTSIFHRRIMPLIPNAGVLFLREDPKILMENLKSTFEAVPTYVYGARTSATQFAIDEAIDIAFAAKHHETAKANLKEWWGHYL